MHSFEFYHIFYTGSTKWQKFKNVDLKIYCTYIPNQKFDSINSTLQYNKEVKKLTVLKI